MYSANWTVSPASPVTNISSLLLSLNILSWSEKTTQKWIPILIVYTTPTPDYWRCYRSQSEWLHCWHHLIFLILLSHEGVWKENYVFLRGKEETKKGDVMLVVWLTSSMGEREKLKGMALQWQSFNTRAILKKAADVSWCEPEYYIILILNPNTIAHQNYAIILMI